MTVLTIDQSNQISDLLFQANSYKGDNIYQDVFYQHDLVDVEATTDTNAGIVILFCGDKLTWDERYKEWCYLSLVSIL